MRLLRDHAAVVRFVETALARARGLSPADVRCLAQFATAAELTAKELTGRLGYCNSRLSHVLDSLERHGLITRRISDYDRRVIVVGLTVAGRAVGDQLDAALLRRYEPALRAIAPPDITAAAAVLSRVLGSALLEQPDDPGEPP